MSEQARRILAQRVASRWGLTTGALAKRRARKQAPFNWIALSATCVAYDLDEIEAMERAARKGGGSEGPEGPEPTDARSYAVAGRFLTGTSAPRRGASPPPGSSLSGRNTQARPCIDHREGNR